VQSNIPVCNRVQSLAASSLAEVATSLFSLTPVEVITTQSLATLTSQVTDTNPTSSSTSIAHSAPTTSTSASSGLSTSDKVAIGAAIPAALIALCGVTLAWHTYRVKSRRRDWQE